ncbi:UDP-N-acetylmuramate dehydrogenase [Ascidiimonas sp. W6]|uniref:UDP-N-acetylmuramate dehydrogenase n=1 Tax=Ascidiimonas meishanensis TaxID=3128903 RepID=UPI0030EBC594
MKIQEQISLKPYNTFGIDVKASHFVAVKTISELRETLSNSLFDKKFILGGGSNMLLTSDVDALVIHLELHGKEVVCQDDTHVLIKAYAGENWHEFVLWTLAQDYGGLENLSLIPGSVGAAPIQNIGAYGVELKDTFVSCEAMEIANGKIHTFSKEACQFSYRDSIFKKSHKGAFVITSVTFRLSNKKHLVNTSYGAIEKELDDQKIKNPTIKQVSEAVIAIRRSKLPNPSEIGNSGSFFKNPVISLAAFEQLKNKYPEIPSYKVSEEAIKVPAGWLIEQCGFKGKRYGDAGVHHKQALVLVNYANASGKEILALAKQIQQKVLETFQINIETEVNII